MGKIKIGRNEPCPCGSGKKFKKCCLNKSQDQRFAETMSKSMYNIKNEARIKRCLHPKQEECDGKIVKAHAIQNNRILNKISENGMLVTMDGNLHNIFQTSDIKGRKVATTFTGFCSYHDKTLFQELEDKDFVATEKQIFLLSYRTMAWHYHKKEEQTSATCIQIEKMYNQGYDLTKSEDFVDYLSMVKLGLEDNNREKQIFDDALFKEEYDIVNSYILELPYEIPFAVSMMNNLEYDLCGNTINDLLNDDFSKNIYLNIFPANGKSFCIWSWLKTNDFAYGNFIKQFAELDIEDKKNYFNNQLPRWTDSIVLSPTLWNKWGEDVQQALITHANFDVIYRTHEREDGGYKYKYMDTPWDFFENINIT